MPFPDFTVWKKLYVLWVGASWHSQSWLALLCFVVLARFVGRSFSSDIKYLATNAL